jgi:putative transposase
VDSQGLLLEVVITAAHVPDTQAVYGLLAPAKHRWASLNTVWADGGYRGPLKARILNALGIRIHVAMRSQFARRGQVSVRRWVVERTFAWLGRYRRLSKDYEFLPETSRAMIFAAMSCLMLKRLAQS